MKVAAVIVCFALFSTAWGQVCEYRLYVNGKLGYTVVNPADPNSLVGSGFNSAWDSKFIIHGFTEDASAGWMIQMKDEFLGQEDLNVFLVDWKEAASGPTYGQAKDNTELVGQETSDMIKFLDKETGHGFSKVHLIGFSLGAHCSGYAGRDTQRLPVPTGVVGRISGLDAAGPGFEGADPEFRLDETDAAFVDAIHTDGEVLIDLGYGIWQEVGHVDFYPNNGTDQPGCTGPGREVCDHGRAHDYFIESIASGCKFTSYPCEKGSVCYSCLPGGCNDMGYPATPSPSGSFYLETNSEYPFCQ